MPEFNEVQVEVQNIQNKSSFTNRNGVFVEVFEADHPEIPGKQARFIRVNREFWHRTSIGGLQQYATFHRAVFAAKHIRLV